MTMIKNRNMLSKTNGSITTIQEYDLINRMVSYTNGTVTAKYSYYLNDMRKSKEIDGITTTHIWFGSNIVIDITESNYVKYVHGYNLINSDYGWYHYNAHGDVVQLTDNNSTVIADYDYDPFGIHMKEAEQDDLNPFRYCSEYYDLESGYVYLRARYYDPEIGRFISEDPARDGFNWFAYCGNNPLRYVDPSGLKAKAIDLEELAKELAKQLGEVDDTWWLTLVEVLTPAGEIAIGLSLVIDIADKLNSKMGVGNFAAVEMPQERKEMMASILQARKYDPDPYARPGQKKQGREGKEKKKEDDWEPRGNKRRPPKPKPHTPGRDHRKY